jgi:hypothetical protein
MRASRITQVLAGSAALAMLPVLWVIGTTDMPSMGSVVAAKTADTLGVWLFTWSLIAVAAAGAVGVAWTAFTSSTE